MQQLSASLRQMARLGRIGMAPLTVSVPLLGAYSTGARPPAGPFIGLALIGLCAHFFGFTLNDIIDRDIDRAHPRRGSSPLAGCAVGRGWALLLAATSVPAAVAIYGALAKEVSGGMAALGASIILSAAYNLWSKRGPVAPLIAEMALAGSVGLLGLAGALWQGGPAEWISLIFCAALALTLLSLNSLPGGLKDLKYDQRAGARSLLLALACRVGEDDRLAISRGAKVYGGVVQVLLLGLIAWLIAVSSAGWLARGAAGLLALLGALHLRLLLSLESFGQVGKALPLLSGYYQYGALALALIDRLPWWIGLIYAGMAAALLAIPLRAGLRVWRGGSGGPE